MMVLNANEIVYPDQKNMRYKCSFCGQEHDEWPALTFSSPTAYNGLTNEEKRNLDN